MPSPKLPAGHEPGTLNCALCIPITRTTLERCPNICDGLLHRVGIQEISDECNLRSFVRRA
jgi:hypothetical protein